MVVITALLLLYFVFVGVRAIALFSSGGPLPIAIGIALIVLPLIGVWALVRELSFGWHANRLFDELQRQGQLPEETVDTRPSGRPDRAQAEAVFPRYRAEAEEAPDSWQSWMRLGIVYEACGDRKRARAAIREAISRKRN